MRTKKYGEEWFHAYVNGKEYSFKCYTTNTRSGFCHTVVSWDYDVSNTKVSYCNRTWERFRYESALARAIEKFPKDMQGELREQLIERKFKAVEKECDEQFDRFKNLYDGLNAENKERMKSFPQLESEGDMRLAMGFMGLLTLMQK